jgi:RNA polymerase sigma-70 factor (ECF subfamily)
MSRHTDNPAYDDRALLELARAGDERAFSRLLEHHRVGLQVVCLMMLGDPEMATLVMTEVVLVAWRERCAVEPSVTPRTWLYRTALRTCGDAEPSAMSLGDEIDLTRRTER